MPTPIGQLLTRTIYAADGVTTTWNFSFSGGYLDKSHVKALTETPEGLRTAVVVTEGMFTGPNTLQITPAIAVGVNLVIYRDTPKDLPLVNFTDEAGFSEVALDTNAKQAVFIAAETTDTVNTGTSYEAEQAAVEAAASAAAAAASYDAFDDRYLGAKSVNPTTDNDGNALLVGALYWNTVANGMRSYTGTSWEDITGVLAQVPATYSFNGTGVQVAFTLPTAPASSKLVTVRVGGVFQEDSAYSVAGAVITFSEAPPVGTSNVDVTVYTPATAGDASSVSYTPTGTGAVATTVQAKLRESVSIKDFGAIGDGVADDTAAIVDALVASDHVVVPSGMFPLISSTIVVSAGKRLDFLGGNGNDATYTPASYFIKKSTMTTDAIQVEKTGVVTGGGIRGQLGNTGDGIALIGNAAKVSDFYVYQIGGVGVRVGTTAGGNFNSFKLDNVTALACTSHGFYIHDGKAAEGADANAGTLLHCVSRDNGGDGFRVGHAFWNSFINCLAETNGGWGLNFSDTLNNGTAEARYNSVIGGDYNESNVSGSAYVGGYSNSVWQPDGGQAMTLTGLLTNSFGGATSQIQAIDLKLGKIAFPATQLASANPNVLDDYQEATFTATSTGIASTPTGTWSYTKIGNQVTLNIATISGTSDATTFTITGIPTDIRPATDKYFILRTQNNGTVSVVVAWISSTGVMTLANNLTGAGGGWTASGTKSILQQSISYTLV